ncbi:MAG TPA: hypothetical protein VF483_01565 [Gemmatimonadaceae bacterium]
MRLRVLAAMLPAVVAGASAAAQDLPLAPVKEFGQTVTPAFEGWYKNPDGSFSISFGYFNRNEKEQLDIPIGPNNNVSPGDANQGQPTHFHPRRHWGVFAVRVPADFGDKKVTWTINFRGKTYAISGSLNPKWEIDALQGEVGSNNTPPAIRFDSAGAAARGPGGMFGPPMRTKVGQPLSLTVFATDDGTAVKGIANDGRSNAGVSLMWFKHQGAGDVAFANAMLTAMAPAGKASTTATFSAPGDYILRIRANDASGVEAAGHAQCCWTNGFVKVTVTP